MSTRHHRLQLPCLGLLLLAAPVIACGQRPATPATPNAELARIAEEDQRDRSLDPAQFARLSRTEQDSLDRWLTARDSVRRVQVRALMAGGAARVSADYLNAAIVIQHARGEGTSTEAFDWASKAMELDSTNAQVRYLVAAAWDRLQVGQGKPQWYGTSVRRRPDGAAELSPIDTTQVTDAVRKRLTGWTLAERRAAVEAMNVRLKVGGKPPEQARRTPGRTLPSGT
jgi:hypothetical protein